MPNPQPDIPTPLVWCPYDNTTLRVNGAYTLTVGETVEPWEETVTYECCEYPVSCGPTIEVPFIPLSEPGIAATYAALLAIVWIAARRRRRS